MKRKYKESDIPQLVSTLEENFEKACNVYIDALTSRVSKRAKKELSRGNSRGTSIYKFQVSFSWILLDICKGPRCLIDDRLADCDELINHINRISNN